MSPNKRSSTRPEAKSTAPVLADWTNGFPQRPLAPPDGSLGQAAGAARAAIAPATTAATAATTAALDPANPGVATQWDTLLLALDDTLRAMRPDTGWLARLLALREQAARLVSRHTDGSLYHLIHSAGQDSSHYSARHGLLCFVLARESARLLDWPAPLVASLELAALTMNTAMHALQDQLAEHSGAISPDERQAIAQHAEQSAALLRQAGVLDATWIEVVRLHHDNSRQGLPLGDLNPVQRAGRLLRRVDVFSAKLSCRRARGPMSPVRAAREACAASGGMPDEIGTALLKAVGLYPPGSCVELASGELGIVVARGPRANLPQVAVLVASDGAPLAEPVLRHSHDRRYLVRAALPLSALAVAVPHERLLAQG